MSPAPDSPNHLALSTASPLRWLKPLAALAVLVAAGMVLHRELAHLHLHEIFANLRATPISVLASALLLTAVSYWLLGFYDVLALQYLGKRIPYGRKLFTSFIAYALGHNLSLAAFTAAAVRLRLYSANGLTAVDVATISGFCSMTTVLGLAILSGAALLLDPHGVASALHFHRHTAVALGTVLLALVVAYTAWAAASRRSLEIRGWSLRPPGARLTFTQLLLATVDLGLSAAVLWLLLPAQTHIEFSAFLGLYALAVTAGLISSVPGGLGVFEAIMILSLRAADTGQLMGALLAYRAVYYLAPLFAATLLFLAQEVFAQRAHLARVRQIVAAYIAPIVPQIASALTFVAGILLLLSGTTPTVDARLATLTRWIPLTLVELSHLAGSVIGLGLLVLARAILRRVGAAYHITFWLLLAGIAASLLKGLDFEEAALLCLVLTILRLGRSAFYRPTSILAQRFTPAWIVSIAGVIAASVWIGFLSYRHVEYSSDLWWTFAFNGNAPRMLRASLVVVVLACGYFLLNLLRPARPAACKTTDDELGKARAVLAGSDSTLGNAALTGDKRLLFSADCKAFIMYQVVGESWVALGDPVGTRAQGEELAWRLRELSDYHGGRTVFYQASIHYLPLYIDLGLAALKLGEEARVPLANFSLDGSARADLRQSHRRAARDGAQFQIVPAAQVPQMMPQLQRISGEWLQEKATAEKRFSVGAFSPRYLRHFDVAVVSAEGVPVAFANLWSSGTRAELSVDLMRFGADAPRSAMDYLFIELMLWGRAQGYRWFNLGMAPLAGLESHPLAPAWHRVGNFVFRHGEHFYNFAGLRRYKAKFDPVWEPRYLVGPGGLALPRILLDVSTLIAGGMKELLVK